MYFDYNLCLGSGHQLRGEGVGWELHNFKGGGGGGGQVKFYP